jgi:hypothetical protein
VAMTEEDILKNIADLEAKILQIALDGEDLSIKEEGSEITVNNNLEAVQIALKQQQALLEAIKNPLAVPKKRATRKLRADYE